MSTLDFQDREPELNRARRTDSQFMAGNSAFYERLQGQGKKSAIERYGWIGVPVAIVAVIGIAAATSTPHQSADDVGGPVAQNNATAATSIPSKPVMPPVNEALASNAQANDADVSAPAASVPAKSPAAAPAPVKVARRAAAPSDTARPAAAAPVERSAPAADTPAPTPAPAVQAPAPVITPPAPVTQDAAPQAAAPAAPATDSSATQAQPSQTAPADAQPAQ